MGKCVLLQPDATYSEITVFKHVNRDKKRLDYSTNFLVPFLETQLSQAYLKWREKNNNFSLKLARSGKTNVP